ncbi:MAG: 2-(1,2-epoxy-1,2-dihydrophenyl)acetyl-CoA isomerase [Hirschia sp.]|nr:2-(1,2-epoxy-1,2-dihydrophenyl)acetyl-CoA isomerase [Hirschia sp.]MBF17085.1 2-(1,2-epoxy-1,2-dihydrophenyl)acetyl-CoA isomerase [Hirschia sp.]|tara:strand:+ start:739 stop:1533 length:795 start_codon:yes stop_codon:yes gene_type:complete
MTSASEVVVEWNGDVAIVRINSPKTLNALSSTNMEQLMDALDQVEDKARAMILTGAGKGFCSGADLSGGIETGAPITSPDYDAGLSLEMHINVLVARLRDLSVPFITSIRGAAAGAGAALALMGDMVVASETAYFLQAFSGIGLVPDAGATHLLVRTVGRVRAMELMMLGEKLYAEKALEWGLINRVVPDDQLEAASLEMAQRLASGAFSLRQIRKMAWHAMDDDWDNMLNYERDMQRIAGRTQDHKEGVMAFMEKRRAKFSGK